MTKAARAWQHAADHRAHARQVHQRLVEAVACELAGDLGDVDGVVTNSLQVRDDLHRGADQPKIPRHGLLQRNETHALALDLDIEVVDAVVGAHHGFGQRDVLLCQRVHCLTDHLIDLTAHLQ